MQAASLVLHGGEIPTYLDQLLLTYAQEMPEVQKVGGMLISTVIYEGRADLFYGITDEVKDIKPKWILDGSWFEGPDSVILGYELARDFHKKPGDTILIGSLNREFVSAVPSERTAPKTMVSIFCPWRPPRRYSRGPGN